MSPTILMYIIQVLEAIPAIIKAGQSVTELVTQTSANLRLMQAEGRDPSAEEWAAQAATIDKLRNQLHEV